MEFFKKTNNNIVANVRDINYLCNLYETDKGTADHTTLSWHKTYPTHRTWSYTKTYEKYMNDAMDKPIKMMEIGICDNRFPYASTKVWTSFFSNLELYSVDNFWNNSLENKVHEIKTLNKMGANFIYADQGSFKDWEEMKKVVPNDLDFFIEDGSHFPNHMAVTLWQSCDMMKSGGYYFMEDIQNPLKSRGWFKYDNSLLAQELLETTITKEFNSSFLNEKQNLKVNETYELVELVLDKTKINYLAVFRKR